MASIRPEWRFFLADRVTRQRLGLLTHASSRVISLALNEDGSASFSHPVEDPISSQIQTMNTYVIAERQGEVKWSGPVWTRSVDFASGMMDVSCVGWKRLLSKRFVSKKMTFNTVDAGEIVGDMLDAINGDYPSGITRGYITPTQPRSTTYEQYTFLSEVIDELSAIESGFDIAIDPDTLEMRIYAKQGEDRPQIQFGYGKPPFNLSNLVLEEDASEMCNYFVARGEVGAKYQDDQGSIDLYGMLQDTDTLSGVVNQGILGAYAGAEVTIRAIPITIFTMSPKTTGDATGTPRAFIDFDIGDVVYLSALRGEFELTRRAQRIYGFDLTIDDEGNESLGTLKTSVQ